MPKPAIRVTDSVEMSDDVDRGVSQALESLRTKNSKVVVLEGMDEVEMVAKAGELAKKGKLPIVRALGSKLTARANEGMLENQISKRKVIYIGEHAGLIPADNVLNQATRDIGIVRTITGVGICEPSTEVEAGLMTAYLVEKFPRSAYMRVAGSRGFLQAQLPKEYKVAVGGGCVVREGAYAVFIAAGPVMLAQALAAAEVIERKEDIHAMVINLPWHVDMDTAWLGSVLRGVKFVVVLDNHVMRGSQSEELRRIFKFDTQFSKIAGRYISIDDLPRAGKPMEILQSFGLDGASVAKKTMELING